MKKVAIEFSFLLPHKINGGAMITFLIARDMRYSLQPLPISYTFIRTVQSIRGICWWPYQPVFSFFPLLLLLFADSLVAARSLFFSQSALYETFLSFPRGPLISPPASSVRRSFCKPADRKKPATLLSRHCLSEQTAWSCLRAK